MYPLTSGRLAANLSGDEYGNPRYGYYSYIINFNCLLYIFFIS